MFYRNVCFTTVFLVMFFVTMALAQPTITRNDIPTAIGSEYTLVSGDQLSYTVDLGSPGGNQTWNYSTLDLGTLSSYTSVVVDVAETGYEEYFPTANLASTLDDDDFEMYSFNEITNDYLRFLGMAGSDGDTTMIMQFEATPTFNFPVQYNDQWTTTMSFSLTIDFGGGIVMTMTSEAELEWTVDGWGTVTLPDGNTFDNCLRAQILDTTTIITEITGLPPQTETTTDISYDWYRPGVHGYILSISSQEGETNPDFTDAALVSYYSGEGVGIENEAEIWTLETKLQQNYPNPFNPVTSIQFQLAAASNVSLVIHNSAGQVVRTLIDDRAFTAGDHFSQWDGKTDAGLPVSSGVYHYQLVTDDLRTSRRMILLK